jgi:alanyl-tRNA synthetase
VYERRLRDVVSEATRLLSVQTSELPDAVARLQADAREAQKQARALGESIAVFEAEGFAREAVQTNGHTLVARVIDRDGAGLKTLAQAVAALGPAAVLVSQARPALVVVARGGDATLDAGAIIKALVARFGGKGGGRPELAQAGGIDADAHAICVAASELLGG